MEKYKKLIKNIAYFLAGNVSSKLLVFLLVPYYTHVLSTEEYGTADLISTTAFMLIPIVTLSITEAVFRFSMDEKAELKAMFTNGISTICFGNILLLVLMPLLARFEAIKSYVWLLFGLTFADGIYNMAAQFVRGCGRSKLYAIGGVVQTAALVSLNLIFLLVLKLGVKGYILSMTLSYVVALVLLVIKGKLVDYIGKPDFYLLKQMLLYSIPMIPSGLSWWAMASADKYVILAYVGAAANGIYLVAQKIPTILNVFITIFHQAWQISAVDDNKESSTKEFSEDIYKYLQLCVFLTASAIVVILKPLYRVWVSNEYYSAWIYTPMLLLATVYSCLSKFMTTNYMVTKKTAGNLKVTITGCVVNLGLNLILIPMCGLQGAAFATFFGYLITFIMTYNDVKVGTGMKIPLFKLIVSTLILLLQGFILSLPSSAWIPMEVGILLLHSYIYHRDISLLFKRIVSYVKYSGGGYSKSNLRFPVPSIRQVKYASRLRCTCVMP